MEQYGYGNNILDRNTWEASKTMQPVYNPYRNEHDSIIVAGIFLIIMEGIILIIFFIGGEAVLSVLQGIMNLVTSSEMATHSPLIISCFYIMFAIAFMIPVVWFFVWIARREKGFQFRRFY